MWLASLAFEDLGKDLRGREMSPESRVDIVLHDSLVVEAEEEKEAECNLG